MRLAQDWLRVDTGLLGVVLGLALGWLRAGLGLMMGWPRACLGSA